MKSIRLPLWLVSMGGLLLLPGIVWLATSGMRINDEDASIAFQPLAQIDLEGLRNAPLSARFTIPDTARWKKIRRVWGAPDLVIAAVQRTRRSVLLCLPAMPLRIELTDSKGMTTRLEDRGEPYGYSSTCAPSSLQFHAAPGDELTLRVNQTTSTATAGYLMVIPDWLYTKDHLVGLDLDDDISAILEWVSIFASVLVVSGTGILVRNRHHRVLG